jgi:hypothetical protein
MREHTWYIHEGLRGGQEETVAETAWLCLETAMFLSREGIRRYHSLAATRINLI